MLFRAWFELTVDEQKAVLLVVALVVLGLSVRAWRQHRAQLELPTADVRLWDSGAQPTRPR